MSYTYSRPATPEERRQGLRRHNTSVSVGPSGMLSSIEWFDEEFTVPGTPLPPITFLPMIEPEPELPPGLSRETARRLAEEMAKVRR
jgi:hypothetical protein